MTPPPFFFKPQPSLNLLYLWSGKRGSVLLSYSPEEGRLSQVTVTKVDAVTGYSFDPHLALRK